MKTILTAFRPFMSKLPAFLGLFVLSFTFVEPALANDPANPAILGLASILSVFIHILTFLVLMIMSWGGDLIGTTFVTGPDAMEAIRPMWVFVRNLVNISFVLVLLFLAFANLFSSLSGGQGNWTIKDKLPRVIIALIAVNFSLLIFRVAIDAVHVGTITILSISDTIMDEKGAYNPASIINSGINNSTWESCDSPEQNFSGNPAADEGAGGGRCLPFYAYVEHALCPKGDGGSDCLAKFSDDVKDPSKPFISASSSTEQNIFWAFGTYFQKLELLPILAGKLNTITGVVSSTLFSGIMAIMYAVAWVAIFIALAIRVVMLWFFMIMSPALVAAQIMGVGSGGSVGNFNIQQSLMTNLIMPLKIAAAFALSFVMIATMIEVTPENHTTILEAGSALKPFWGVKTGVFGIMWQIMTVVVFWMAVWWALSGSEAEFINNGIKGATEQVGKYTGNWALDQVRIPAIGSTGEKGPSIRSLGDIGSVLRSEEASRTRKNRDALGSALGFGPDSQAMNKFDEVVQRFSGASNLMNRTAFQSNVTPQMLELADKDRLKKLYGTFNEDVRTALSNSSARVRDGDADGFANAFGGSVTQDQIRSILQPVELISASAPATPAQTPSPSATQVTIGAATFEINDQGSFNQALNELKSIPGDIEAKNSQIRDLADRAITAGDITVGSVNATQENRNALVDAITNEVK